MLTKPVTPLDMIKFFNRKIMERDYSDYIGIDSAKCEKYKYIPTEHYISNAAFNCIPKNISDEEFAKITELFHDVTKEFYITRKNMRVAIHMFRNLKNMKAKYRRSQRIANRRMRF